MYLDGDYEKTSDPINIEVPGLKVAYADDFGVESTIWSLLGNLSYKFNPNNMIGFTIMKNNSGEASSRLDQGITTDPDTYTVVEKSLGWLQRSITSSQLKGKHVLPGWNNGTFDWLLSYTESTQDEPDLRFFKADSLENRTPEETYELRPNNKSARFYRFMTETNLDAKINYIQPFDFAGRKAKVKVGGGFITKERNSDESKYVIDFQGAISFDGLASSAFNPDNFLGNGTSNYLYYTNSLRTDALNSYVAYENVYSGYALLDLPLTEKLRIVTGARYEYTDIFIENKIDTLIDQVKYYESGGFDAADILPSVNATYALTEDMNIRLAYNKTIARPVFRELAPYASYNYKAGYRVVGNPDLERTTIANLDFRWEWYMNRGELISVSAFYKDFTNPIELRDVEQAANPEIHVENIDESQLYGLEFEFRKSLGFLSGMNKFSLGTNITLVRSVVEEDSTKLASANIALQNANPDGGDTWPLKRAMYGQSPYVINAYLNYFDADKGLDANIGFNVSGEKIVLINKAAIPNVMEQAFAKLDFNISKSFANGISLKVSAENLLNPYYSQTQTFNNGEVINFRRYKLGRQYSFGITYAIK